VIVEFDGTATDRAAATERVRRHLARDGQGILATRAGGDLPIWIFGLLFIEGRRESPVFANQRGEWP
jgi:hypothetical protein